MLLCFLQLACRQSVEQRKYLPAQFLRSARNSLNRKDLTNTKISCCPVFFDNQQCDSNHINNIKSIHIPWIQFTAYRTEGTDPVFTVSRPWPCLTADRLHGSHSVDRKRLWPFTSRHSNPQFLLHGGGAEHYGIGDVRLYTGGAHSSSLAMEWSSICKLHNT